MTLHLQELEQIRRREAESTTENYGICYLAFEGCIDAKDPNIFYGFCDKNWKGCFFWNDN